MSTFRFFSPFSMRDPFFFGIPKDIDPRPTTGLPQITNFFSLETGGIARIDLSGTFFSNAISVRDGTIRSLRLGNIIAEENGDPTNLISATPLATELNADRSRFDNLVLSGNALATVGHLGSGDDFMVGSDGSDEFGADDTIRGTSGNDSLTGAGGEDNIRGGLGADNISGDAKDDVLRGNGGFDVINGGSGDDLMFGGSGADTLRGGSGEDTVNGNGGSDQLDGAAGDDVISGDGGKDIIDAGAGDDIARGGNGTDTIEGGAGDDTLTGGSRADTFVFASDGSDDVVTDYQDDLDKIQITGNFDFADIDIDQDGANAIISFGSATITLNNQDATELTEADFLF